MPRPLPDGSPAELEEIREHYAIEVELADRLRRAPREDRRRLYNEVYDELFRRVPWHVQHRRGPADRRQSNARMRGFLQPWLTEDAAVMEIGAGDASFSLELAGRVAQAYAVDVSRGVFVSEELPANFTFLLSDGIGIPLPDGAVDLAFSNQLIEHVHPEDVQPHLQEVRRVLRPGGRYVILTPNRFSGPHDISGYFDDDPRGFHLREFTCGDLGRELHAAGFREVRHLLRVKTQLLKPHLGIPTALEAILERQPRDRQRRLARRTPIAQLIATRLVARR